MDRKHCRDCLLIQRCGDLIGEVLQLQCKVWELEELLRSIKPTPSRPQADLDVL